ncbi:hypothetical protein Tco_0857398 [Tanacetum coccineum]|uniref:Uncharacterized protein n=1 Tax=Tanacetum coccineum TaxID=301880 RepID=A0ABQ5B651_9ASTR
MDKSQSYMSHDKHQELFDALLNSIMLDKAIASGDVNPDKVLRKRDRRDDQDPTAGSDQGKQKRRKGKDYESYKDKVQTGSSSKGKTHSKPSSTNKPVNAEEPLHEAEMDVEEPILDDVVNEADQPQNESAPTQGNPTYKPLPLQGSLGHLTIPSDFFFNNDLEYVKTAAQKLYTFKEGDFLRIHLNDIEDMLLLHVQNKLFNLEGDAIVDLAVALRMFTQRIVIQKRVEDVQLGVESYQKKLNISRPQKDCSRISVKEPYTPSYDPKGVIYEDKQKHKRLMRIDELYKFCDGTLRSVRQILHERVKNFKRGYNKDMHRRKWTTKD